MITEGGLGEAVTGRIMVFSGYRVTIEGKQISEEDTRRMFEDSKRKLIDAFLLRRAHRAKEKAEKMISLVSVTSVLHYADEVFSPLNEQK